MAWALWLGRLGQEAPVVRMSSPPTVPAIAAITTELVLTANSKNPLVSLAIVVIQFEPVTARTPSSRRPRTLRRDVCCDHCKMGAPRFPAVLVALNGVKPTLSIVPTVFRHHHHANPLASMRRGSRYATSFLLALPGVERRPVPCFSPCQPRQQKPWREFKCF